MVVGEMLFYRNSNNIGDLLDLVQVASLKEPVDFPRGGKKR